MPHQMPAAHRRAVLELVAGRGPRSAGGGCRADDQLPEAPHWLAGRRIRRHKPAAAGQTSTGLPCQPGAGLPADTVRIVPTRKCRHSTRETICDAAAESEDMVCMHVREGGIVKTISGDHCTLGASTIRPVLWRTRRWRHKAGACRCAAMHLAVLCCAFARWHA
jgi:hypothetical protein